MNPYTNTTDAWVFWLVTVPTLLVLALTVGVWAVSDPEAPEVREPDTLGLVACTADGCTYLDLSGPPPDAAILYVPDLWYRDLQAERDSLETVIAKLRPPNPARYRP